MEYIKGFIAVKSFYTGKQYYKDDPVNISKHENAELERLGLIRWVERPKIIFPGEVKEIVKPKRKKRVRKSK